jgi:hypothetical protein
VGGPCPWPARRSMRGPASTALSYEQAQKIEAQLLEEGQKPSEGAEQADQAQVRDASMIPDELARRQQRLQAGDRAVETKMRVRERFERRAGGSTKRSRLHERPGRMCTTIQNSPTDLSSLFEDFLNSV